MAEAKTNKQLQEQNEQLKREIELLKAKISELEARLAQYENAHTPPSLRRSRNRKKDDDNKGKPGQKIGHKGVTRPYATPDNQVEVTADRCPDCGIELGPPFRIESKIIEEFPNLSLSWSLNIKSLITDAHFAGKKLLRRMQVAHIKANSETTQLRRRRY